MDNMRYSRPATRCHTEPTGRILLPLLFRLQRCDGAWQLLYSIQFNTIRANEKSRNCIWTAGSVVRTPVKKVPAGLGGDERSDFAMSSSSFSSLDPSSVSNISRDVTCYHAADRDHFLMWSALISSSELKKNQSVRFFCFLVRCGENNKKRRL